MPNYFKFKNKKPLNKLDTINENFIFKEPQNEYNEYNEYNQINIMAKVYEIYVSIIKFIINYK